MLIIIHIIKYTKVCVFHTSHNSNKFNTFALIAGRASLYI